VVVAGRWCLTERAPPAEDLRSATTSGSPTRITFDVKGLTSWDSRFVAFVAGVAKIAAERNVPVDQDSLPPGVRQLLRLAEAKPRAPPPRVQVRPPVLMRVGTGALARVRRFKEVLANVGEMTAACGRLVAGRGHRLGPELMLQMELSGVRALGIVSLVGFLVGVILAFVGAIELKPYGATLGDQEAVDGRLEEAGRSAADVGRAATAAVVESIVLIIGACGVFAVVFYMIGV